MKSGASSFTAQYFIISLVCLGVSVGAMKHLITTLSPGRLMPCIDEVALCVPASVDGGFQIILDFLSSLLFTMASCSAAMLGLLLLHDSVRRKQHLTLEQHADLRLMYLGILIPIVNVAGSLALP